MSFRFIWTPQHEIPPKPTFSGSHCRLGCLGESDYRGFLHLQPSPILNNYHLVNGQGISSDVNHTLFLTCFGLGIMIPHLFNLTICLLFGELFDIFEIPFFYMFFSHVAPHAVMSCSAYKPRPCREASTLVKTPHFRWWIRSWRCQVLIRKLLKTCSTPGHQLHILCN